MDSCSASSPEEDVAIARTALAKGDYVHAAHHLACALGEDPNRSDWLGLFDQVIAAEPDAEKLAPIKSSPPAYCTVAAHAYILARLGRVAEAIDLILQTIHVRPDVLYIEWALSWLARPEVAGQLNMTRIAWFISALVQRFPALNAPHGGGKATLERMPEFIRRVRQAQPNDSRFLAVSVSMLRRLGLTDEALEYANAAYQIEPGFQTAVAVAVAHESRHDVEAALAAYRDALRFDRDDISCRLSMADLLWQYDRLAEARDLYAEVLERDRLQPWALPSFYYLRFALEGKEEWRDRLLALAEGAPENERADQLAQRASAYFGYLPEPSDAITNSMRQAQEQGAKIMSLAVTSLEAPSNYLAFPQLAQMQVSVGAVPSPDVRQPRRPVEYVLWRYAGTRPVVAVAAPPESIAREVAALAGQPYQLQAWLRQAGKLAHKLGPETVGALLATMVHPPMPPGIERPWAWVFRVQVAAALVIAQLESSWDDSARKKALLSLVYGPMDWTVDAALLALTIIAQDEEDRAAEISAVFRDLLHSLPQGGPVCYYSTLLWCGLRLPGLKPEERAEFRQRLRRHLGTDEADTLLEQAAAHEDKGELKEAAALLDQALQLRPAFPEALRLRGLVICQMGELEKALGDFSEAIRLQPNDATGYYYRGQAHLDLEKFNEAIHDFGEAIRLKPDAWPAYQRRAIAHAGKQDWEAAHADFAKAIELNDRVASIFIDRARMHIDRKEWDPALADLDRAGQLDARSAAVHAFRAIVHKALNQPDRAIQDYAARLKLEPKNAQVYNLRAAVHYGTDDFAAAIADHLMACEIAPNDATSFNHVAWIWATCPRPEFRDGAKALEYATRACKLTGYEQAFCLDTLAAAHAVNGKFADAVKWAEKAVELVEEASREDYRSRLELYRAGKAFFGK